MCSGKIIQTDKQKLNWLWNQRQINHAVTKYNDLKLCM